MFVHCHNIVPLVVEGRVYSRRVDRIEWPYGGTYIDQYAYIIDVFEVMAEAVRIEVD